MMYEKKNQQKTKISQKNEKRGRKRETKHPQIE